MTGFSRTDVEVTGVRSGRVQVAGYALWGEDQLQKWSSVGGRKRNVRKDAGSDANGLTQPLQVESVTNIEMPAESQTCSVCLRWRSRNSTWMRA